jgi:AcrR family transcriptional regulator
VARTVDSAHRDELIEAVARDLLRNGLVGASLDRLATAAGTSGRMLVHHFGSRQELIDRALERCREWELARARIELPPGPDFPDVLSRAWTWFGGEEAGRFFRLFGQLAAASRLGADRAPVSRSRLSTEWLAIVSDGFAACGCDPAAAQRLATVYIAQVRGLLLDLDATGDSLRVEGAYHHFMAVLVRSPDLPETKPRPSRTRRPTGTASDG